MMHVCYACSYSAGFFVWEKRIRYLSAEVFDFRLGSVIKRIMDLRLVKYFFPLLILICSSCYNYHSDKILRQIERNCKNKESCEIRLGDVFTFSWDTMYIFSSYTYPQDVSSEIGYKYQGDIVPDDLKLIIFMLEGKPVSEAYVNFEGFRFTNFSRTGVYRIERNRLLTVEKRKNYGRDFYLLIQ